MHQAHDSSLGVAIPKTPLRAVDLSQRMAANPTIDNSAYALCDSLEIRESHRDVKPIQNMLGMWQNLLLNGPQTGIAVGENCDPAADAKRRQASAAARRVFGPAEALDRQH